jgi:hypothetical protein
MRPVRFGCLRETIQNENLMVIEEEAKVFELSLDP